MDHQWNPISGFQPQSQQQPQQTNTTQTQYITPDQEITVARNQMFESVQHLAVSLRTAANQCENFVKVVARHHPSAAASAFASNVGADFMALASGTNIGAQSLAAAAAAAVGASGGAGALGMANLANLPKRPLTKEDRKILRKQRKLNRDPNAPKRPPSAYLLFQNEIREQMRQQYKDLPYSQVLGKISEAWKDLTEEERKVYNDRTMEHMASWNQQKREQQDTTGFVDNNHVGGVDPTAAAQTFNTNGMMTIASPRGRKPGSKNKRSKKA